MAPLVSLQGSELVYMYICIYVWLDVDITLLVSSKS